MAIMLLMMVLMATFSSAAECADAEQQAARLEQLRKRIGGIKQELGSLRGEHDSVQDALATTERDIGSVTAELRRLEQASRQALDNIQLLQQERSDYQHELDKQRAALARELQSAYMTGKQQRVKLLLNQEDPASVSRMLAYHGYFSRARAARMQDYRASLERLATLEQQLLAQRAEAERSSRRNRRCWQRNRTSAAASSRSCSSSCATSKASCPRWNRMSNACSSWSDRCSRHWRKFRSRVVTTSRCSSSRASFSGRLPAVSHASTVPARHPEN